MKRPVIILGGGGHAKVLINALVLQAVEIIGFTDILPAQMSKKVLGIEFLGEDSVILQHATDTISLVNGLGSVGDTTLRKQLFCRFMAQGYRFAEVIHPSAIIASDTILSEGVQVMAGAIIQPGCKLGKNTIINTKAAVDHDCVIGNHVHLAPGVTLSGQVQVGDCTHIGTGATVIQGIAIGQGSLIGAGAVVTKDVPDGVTVVGSPARVVHV